MTEAEAKLTAVWNADAPPQRDALFRIALMERLERRRLRTRLIAVVAAGVTLTLAAVVFAPALNMAGAELLTLPLSREALAAAAAALAASVALWAHGRMRSARLG